MGEVYLVDESIEMTPELWEKILKKYLIQIDKEAREWQKDIWKCGSGLLATVENKNGREKYNLGRYKKSR